MHELNGRLLLVAALLAFTVGLTPNATGIPSFDGNTGWLNGPALDPGALRGKVVLVDFWEYTCINCLRTLPYLRAWYERYRDDGFVIVGIHTPEFVFSADMANVAAASRNLGVSWPVALDDDRTIWGRYKNDGWPHEYLFDRSGRLVESVAGEGRYTETETQIQALLRADEPQRSLPPVMALLPQDSYDKPGALCYLGTPELLVGHAGIANATAFGDPSRDLTYTDGNANHKDGALYLAGLWHLTPQAAAVSENVGAYAGLRYHAIQVVAVLAPSEGKTVRVAVTQDGAPVAKSAAGRDVRFDSDGTSYVTVDTPRAYELVNNATFGQHDLRLSASDFGLGIYSFAFESCEVPTKSSEGGAPEPIAYIFTLAST